VVREGLVQQPAPSPRAFPRALRAAATARLAILAGEEILERFEALDEAVGAEEESRDRELEAKYDEAWLAVMREARRYQWHDDYKADWNQAYADEMTYEQRLLA
jgi:hypothetical protein